MAQSERDNSMASEQRGKAEAETTISMPQLPRKHAMGTRKSSRKEQEQEQGEQNIETVAPQVLLPRKKLKPNPAANSLRSPNYIVLDNETKCQDLLRRMRNSEVDPQDMQTLEVHLDTNKLSDIAEYHLARIFKELNPRSDNTNPHGLQDIQLVVKDNLLFTRYSYHLVSPCLSNLAGDKLRRLVEGKLNEKQKKELPYKINRTEKVLAKALLGIRGVKQVSIKGRGTMEADFAATIKATLIQPPGTSIVEASDAESRFSTHRFNKLGTICSDAHSARAHRPYPTVSGNLEYDFSRLVAKKRFLVNEKTELAAHLSGLDDRDAQAVALVKHRGPGSREPVQTFEVGPIAKSSLRPRGTKVKRKERKQVGEDDETATHDEDEGDSLGLKDMIRINKKKVDPRDVGSQTLDISVMPVILTAREEAVELGWKV